MAARPFEGHAIAFRADRLVGDARGTVAVEREKSGDTVLVGPLGEQIARAAQVAPALFADGADEEDRAPGSDLCRVERARLGGTGRQSARIVSDARRNKTGDFAATRHRRRVRENRASKNKQE